MTPDLTWAALLVFAVALALWPAPGGAGLARWTALLEAAGPTAPEPSVPGPPQDPGRERLRRWVLAAALGGAVALLLGGAAGAVAGGVVAVGVERVLRARGSDGGAADRVLIVRDLPAACDLLGVCLSAGLPVEGALEAVGGAVGGPLGEHLRSVAALSRLGADARRAWAEVPAELAGLGRVLVRAGESGATVAGSLRTLAAESRATARAATQAAVQRAGVWVLAPLGACFLPAFVCLGVAPLVLGIADDVFR
ncbi:Type II secretion system (T2SS), protein F [Blastococcus aurantiacus]|uniref:Type II secretion system (T2SS), protein F n=1 Tax=Blastococcus aurantiacus TaxID=1550231 RepID=A0A1G7MJX6_9ACTN|nr:type II secretion system F family protein [Blastococcus aurantiacus]SDF61420.1 Type II secretion system (T2SS), protein F [Blastococcus aurantiacus]